MRAGSLRGAPLARLVSAYYAVHAGPCSVIRIASAWRKKLPTRKCGSAYPNCATCSPECCGAGGTALNTCCIGPSGEDDTNSGPCTATIESADRLCPHSIYNCSTRIGEILQTEFKRVYPRCLSHRIHVRLTRKVVRGRCEPAIGSLAQRGLRRMVLDQLVGDLIWSADGGRARIVVVMLPRNQRTVSPDARLDLNHTGRAEIPQVNSSRRVHTTFTGLPAALARRAASIAA